MVNAADGVLGIEWIDGSSVRCLLPGGAEEEEEIIDQGIENKEDTAADDLADPLKRYGISVGECNYESSKKKNFSFKMFMHQMI